jgi:DNA-directed RNA polymerase alpha subunit
MLYPAAELPDDTPIQNVRFSTRIRNALNAAGMKTIGDVRVRSSNSQVSARANCLIISSYVLFA